MKRLGINSDSRYSLNQRTSQLAYKSGHNRKSNKEEQEGSPKGLQLSRVATISANFHWSTRLGANKGATGGKNAEKYGRTLALRSRRCIAREWTETKFVQKNKSYVACDLAACIYIVRIRTPYIHLVLVIHPPLYTHMSV